MNTVKPDKNIHTATVQKIWKWLSPIIPHISSQDYKDAHVKYINTIVEFGANPYFGPPKLPPDKGQTMPSNAIHFENVSYEYQGLARIKSMVDKGVPIAFITWHHGALHHTGYALARILPHIAIFTLPNFQYGEVFSHSMEKDKALSLIKMDRFLKEGRPILYSIDGPPLGKCKTLKILGVEAEFSTAPIKIMRMVENVRIVPVTSYYVKKGEGVKVQTIFHDPLPHQDMLTQVTDREILTSLISCLEKDLCERAPEQISMTFFVSRQLLANEISLKRFMERQETI